MASLILSKKANELIEHYFNLKIGGKLVKCPYYINHKSKKADLRSLVGKGSPTEIEDEVKIWAKVKKFDLFTSTPFQIRQFMRDNSIGIDCSGLVSYIIEAELKSRGLKISNVLNNSFGENFWFRMYHRLRFIENLSVQTISNPDNIVKIENLSEIKPLDMLHLKGLIDGFHIAIVYETGTNDEGKKYIHYVHSSKWYNPDDGIRKGQIILTSSSNDLTYQTWIDDDKNGINFIKQEYANDKKEGYFIRLKNIN